MFSRFIILAFPLLLKALKRLRPRNWRQRIALFLIIGALGYLNEEFGRYSVLSDRVIDGDTFVMDQQKIRLWGIDTPERNEFGYEQATATLRKLIKKQELDCVFINRDVYRRALMRCRLPSGDDLGAQMVLSGWARDFTKYSNSYYKVEENKVRRAQRGLWAP